jgi:hypothetical protein
MEGGASRQTLVAGMSRRCAAMPPCSRVRTETSMPPPAIPQSMHSALLALALAPIAAPGGADADGRRRGEADRERCAFARELQDALSTSAS